MIFGPDVKPTVSFKGTAPGCGEDWKNNTAQAVDRESLYYRKAIAIGRALEKKSMAIEFTGHSLGGGLSSAAARASGKSAHTFNAAGLHPNTVARYGGEPKIPDPDNIMAVRVQGDILTVAQESSVVGVLAAMLGGTLGGVAGGISGAVVGGLIAKRAASSIPKAAGIPHQVSGTGLSPLNRHGMTQIIEGIEQQKQEDQRMLTEYANS